jgi:hypothetical protein
MTESIKTPRNFTERAIEEQQDFMTQTWCNACQKLDLGMHTVEEYEVDDIVFVEGKCNICSDSVVTEIAGESTDGEWEE